MRQRMIPWPLLHEPVPRPAPQETGTPGQPDYLQLGRWWDNLAPGHSCARGWVSAERFASSASEAVIPRTNRSAQRRRRRRRP